MPVNNLLNGTAGLPVAETEQIKNFWSGMIPLHSIVVSVIVIFSMIIVRYILVKTLNHETQDTKARKKRARRISLLTGILSLTFLLPVWLPTLQSFAAVLGIFGAGIILIFREILLSMAGWLYLHIRKPYVIGDRIQMGNFSGEVIDIRLLGTVLSESDTTDGSDFSGRTIHIPNAKVMTEIIANMGDADAIQPFVLTFSLDAKSNLKRAEEILLSVATKKIEITSIRKPQVHIEVKGKAVVLRLRLYAPSLSTRQVSNELYNEILELFAADENIDLCELK